MNKKPLLIGLILFLIFLFIGALFTKAIISSEDKSMREELLLQAQLIEKSVDLQSVSGFSASEKDLDLPDYQMLKAKFTKIKLAYPKCRFIYLLGQHPNGEVFFFLDSEPADSKDNSPPGQIFSEVAENIRNIFSTEKGIVDGPQKDRWGVWVSSFAPVLDPQSGEIIAVLGMDIDAHTWMWTIFMRSFLSLSFFLMTCALISIFLYLQYRNKQGNLRLVTTQSALKDSENKYHGFFTNFQDAIIILEPPNWRFLTANPAMLKMFGIKDEQQLLSLGPVDLSPELQPDGAVSTEKSRELIETALRQGYLFFEWRHKRFNGDEFPATVWMSKTELGGRTVLQIIVRDITEEKKIEEENAKHMKELEVFYKISMGREERIIELKKEVERLKRELTK